MASPGSLLEMQIAKCRESETGHLWFNNPVGGFGCMLKV